jgi:hypothetical protein
MQLLLNYQEIGIILASELMYNGVPFHKTIKRKLTKSEIILLAASENRFLVAHDTLFNEHNTNPEYKINMHLSEDERLLWLDILKSCSKECVEEFGDYHLYLGTRDKNDVEELITIICCIGRDNSV